MVSHRKEFSMSDPNNRRSPEEWYSLIMECRQSGMTDRQWCLANDINHDSFYSAIKRLKKCSYAIPSHQTHDIHDLTLSRQEVVQVGIIPDARPSEVSISKPVLHIDNSHMIEITVGDIHISLCNGADPVLVSTALSAIRAFT